MATKLEGGGGGEGKALVAGPLKKDRFLRLPLVVCVTIDKQRVGQHYRKNTNSTLL